MLASTGGQIRPECGDHVIDRPGQLLRHVLRQLRHAQALRAHDLARIGLLFPGNELQQGGLARAVAAEQAQPLAGLEREVGLVQQHGAAQVQADVLEAEQHVGAAR